jgi:hypothetical protein
MTAFIFLSFSGNAGRDRDELDSCHDGAQVSYTLTRSQPPGRIGYSPGPPEGGPLTFLDSARRAGIDRHRPDWNGVGRDVLRLMPELNIQTFRPMVMIVVHSGRIEP